MNATEPNLDPVHWFGRVITDTLESMADDYQRIADHLRGSAANVPRIGDPSGLAYVTATGLLIDVLGDIDRNTPSPARLVKSVADYEKHVSGPRPGEAP